MNMNFGYLKAGSLAEAVQALRARGAKLHAGGTDLLGCARDGVFQVERVISIVKLKELKGISGTPAGGIRLGALTTLAEIASGKAIEENYTALAQAAAAVGTPQIREQGTIGGNLCQRPRCWYFRSDLQCLKKGGDLCYGFGGENQYHAIFGGGPCFSVHPSDMAVALVALQAQLAITGASGNKTVKVENFFVGPDKNIEKENILAPGEIVTGIRLPPAGRTMKSTYRKIRARGSWDFALTSVAAALQFDGDKVSEGRIVLGGVAPYPWRIDAATKLLAGKKLDDSIAASIAEAAVSGANPLSGNGYKIDMVKGAVQETLLSLI